ncbi:MAG: NAD(P)-binding protein [Pseudomonadota bacterium]
MKHITRRDFLNGTQVALGASLLSPWSQSLGAVPYPPARTGLRGSHNGSFETMHALVGGASFDTPLPDETVDLLVVGAGISGLAAAHTWRAQRGDDRILLLDNHDDFGGHAKRNEFTMGARTQIAYGGTEAIDTPSSYSRVSKKMLKDIGIDVQRFYRYYDQTLYEGLGMGMAVVFDEATYGQRRVAVGYGSVPWEDFVRQTPLNERARADLIRLFTDRRDYFPELSDDEKRAHLRRLSYHDFLKDVVRVDPQILEMYRRWGISFWCVGTDEIPSLEVQSYGDGGGMPGLSHTFKRHGARGDEPYIFHFPDGNASIARLLVRSLLPHVVPGKTMEDSVTARVRYDQLDAADQATRIRLNSTVVRVAHSADEKSVDVTYVRDGRLATVRARHCVMACYNSAIPYLCPELPETQVEGLKYNVKIPLVYTKVAVRQWQPFVDLGASFVYYTNDFYKQVELDYPVSIGDYAFGSSPKQPMTLHMCHVPYFQDIQGPEQWRAGRRQMLGTTFDTFEHHVLDQLDQALGAHGFDAERDIHAITVNRWSHGYAYSPDLLWEPEWPDETKTPWAIGRQRFGRIAIGNSDAAASADSNAAMTQGHRAATELLGLD